MKFYPGSVTPELGPQTAELLGDLQERRNFDPDQYAEAKGMLLNDYMRDAGLSSVAVAVSGGIDSAVVLALVSNAQDMDGSPIERIFPIALPIYHDEYTKNQEEATARGQELCGALGLEGLIEIDLTKTFDVFKRTVEKAVGIKGDEWASGQGVAYLRTPVNYYTTSLMTVAGQPGILCGTTNRDEGAYLGYVGKASDGVVDVQLISDLHKSEVRRLAEYLDVPQSIIDAAPTGDMYDGREDEQVFGASYEYVELLLLLRSLAPEEREAFVSRLQSEEERRAVRTAFGNLQDLHTFNGHKYNAGSMAYHMDVMESGVPGGWHYGMQKPSRELPAVEKTNNYFTMRERNTRAIINRMGSLGEIKLKQLDLPKGEAEVFEGVLEDEDIIALLQAADGHGWKPTGVTGRAEDYKDGDPIGSWRATTFSPDTADYIWTRIAPFFDAPRIFDRDPQVDVEPHSVWRPVGVAGLMRFIRYNEGGVLIPHYDEPYTYPNPKPTYYDRDLMTLKSLVLYLDSEGIEGGATRFLRDDRIDQPIEHRDMRDRTSLATESEVICRVNPAPGAALIFDHRLLHDAEGVTAVEEDGRKVIIRTDLVYAKC